MATPYLRDIFDMLYQKIARFTEFACDNIRKIYTGYVSDYIIYIILFLALLISAQLKWSVF